MRHRVKGRKLGRTASHRTATLRALATALFQHKKITTTLAKAKEARRFVEPLITKAKEDSVSARRYVARHIKNKDVMKELFGDIIQKIGDRPGGYTRVVKLGTRLGDAAEMAILELVDFNDMIEKKKTKKASKKKQTKKTETDAAPAVVEDNIEEAEIIEEKIEPSSESDKTKKVADKLKESKPKAEKKSAKKKSPEEETKKKKTTAKKPVKAESKETKKEKPSDKKEGK